MINREKTEKIVRGIIMAIFFLPLIITPGVLFPYQYGKVVIFETLVGLLAAWIFVSSFNLKLKTSPVFWAYFSFVAVRLITGFLGDNQEKSFWGDHIRMTGTLTFIFLFIFFILIRYFFRGVVNEIKLLRAISISGALGGILAIVQRGTSLGGNILGKSSDWLFGSFGNPSYFASYILLIIFFTAVLITREDAKNVKRIWSIILLGEIILLIASLSRGSIVGLFAGAIVVGIILLIYSKRRVIRLAGVTAIILPIIFLAGSLIVFFGPGRQSAAGTVLGSLLRSSTAETRLINWRIAVSGFAAKPILGWGPENYEIVFSKFYRPELIKHSYTETWSDRPHNILLEIATGGGIVGVVSYLTLFVAAFWVLVFKKNQMPNGEKALCCGALAAFLGQGLFLFDTWSVLLLFTALLAYLDLRSSDAPRAETKLPFFGTAKTRRFFKQFAALMISVAVFGNIILPVRASYLAARSEEDLIRKDYASFEKDFQSALQAYTPHHDDLAKILADDILKGDAAGFIPPEVVKSVLPSLIKYLEDAAKSHPEVYALTLRSAQVFSLAGEYLDAEYFKKSEQMFNQTQNLALRRQTGLISRIQMEMARGNLSEAVRWSGELLKDNPDLNEAYWLHGLALYAIGQADAAEEVFDQRINNGLAFQGASNAALLRKASVILDFYASRGKYAKMVFPLERLTQNFPESADLHMRLGAVYATLGRFEEARSEALKTISLDPARRTDVEEFIGAVEDLSR